jgi:hypothetical protein
MKLYKIVFHHPGSKDTVSLMRRAKDSTSAVSKVKKGRKSIIIDSVKEYKSNK